MVKIVAATRTKTKLLCEECGHQLATRYVEWTLPFQSDRRSYGGVGTIPICERPQCMISAVDWLGDLAGSFRLVELNGRPS